MRRSPGDVNARPPLRSALVVSADPQLCRWAAALLGAEGWNVVSAHAVETLADLPAIESFLLLVVDLVLPTATVDAARDRFGELPVDSRPRLLVVENGEPVAPAVLDALDAHDTLPRPTAGGAETKLAERRLRTAAAAVRRSAELPSSFFERLFEKLPEAVVIGDASDRVVRTNDAFCRLFGYTHAEVVGREIDDVVAPGAAGGGARETTQRVRAGETVESEAQRFRKDGTAIQVSLLAAPIHVGSGKVGNFAIYRDITERLEAEATLRRSEELYRYLFERNPQPMWVYDLETLRFLAVNRAACSGYGYSADEFLEMTIEDIRPPDELPKLRENLAHTPRSGFERSGTWRHRTRGGQLLWVEITSHDIRFRGRPARFVLAHDVTRRKTMEAALRESEQRYRALFDQSPLGVLHFDRELRVVDCNERFARALGMEPDDLRGFDLASVRDTRVLPALRAAMTGEYAHYEGPYRGTRAGIDAWVAVHLSPLHDAAGEVTGGIAVIEDVTERKAAEARLERQARELEEVNAALQERTAELEVAIQARSRLYAALNHELRTPISAIMLYHDLLLEGAVGALSEAQAENLNHAQRAAGHLLDLVSDVLDLARIEAGKLEIRPAAASMSDLIHEVIDTIRPLARERGSELRLDLPFHGCELVTDARRVRQIVLNLLSNAVKFGEGHPIEVACTSRGPDGVEITVRDRGRGIAAADLDRIFDHFVQVGERREGGAGLGLSICRRLADLLGGRLEVESRVGAGTSFRLLLPAEPPGGHTESASPEPTLAA